MMFPMNAMGGFGMMKQPQQMQQTGAMPQPIGQQGMPQQSGMPQLASLMQAQQANPGMQNMASMLQRMNPSFPNNAPGSLGMFLQNRMKQGGANSGFAGGLPFMQYLMNQRR